MKKLLLKIGVDLLIPIADIIYLKSKGNYTEVVTKKGSMVSSSTLKVLRNRLDDHTFILVRRGLLINKVFIESLENHIIPPELKLISGETFSISTRVYSQIKIDLVEFWVSLNILAVFYISTT